MLKNDNQCWIHLPVDLTDPILSEAAAGLINTVHAVIGKPTVVAGSTNPYFLIIAQIGIAKGASIDRSGEMAACGPITNVDRIPLSLIDLVVGVGGEVENLQVYFELTNLNAVCPFGDGVETWATWGTFDHGNGTVSHAPRQLGNKWYRSSEYGQSGSPRLLASAWVNLSRNNVISVTQYQAIVQENTPSQP